VCRCPPKAFACTSPWPNIARLPARGRRSGDRSGQSLLVWPAAKPIRNGGQCCIRSQPDDCLVFDRSPLAGRAPFESPVPIRKKTIAPRATRGQGVSPIHRVPLNRARAAYYDQAAPPSIFGPHFVGVIELDAIERRARTGCVSTPPFSPAICAERARAISLVASPICSADYIPNRWPAGSSRSDNKPRTTGPTSTT